MTNPGHLLSASMPHCLSFSVSLLCYFLCVCATLGGFHQSLAAGDPTHVAFVTMFLPTFSLPTVGELRS